MDAQPLAIEGCYELKLRRFPDQRGCFVKPFHETQFRALGLATDFREQYYSESVGGVLRGLHFQTPPADHAKLVYCVAGSVLDALVDLRRGSETFGQHATVELSAEGATAVYLPSGIAHGFYVRSERAVMIYNVTTVHSPAHDLGIHWNSVGINWPDAAPIVSQRDEQFPALQDFSSPFVIHSNPLRKAS